MSRTQTQTRPDGVLGRLVESHPLLWVLLALPGLWLVVQWATGAWTYGAVVSQSGVWAAELLIVTLAVTPLRLLFRRGRWLTWLVRRRRDLGVATFAYAAGHTIVYLIRKAGVGLIVSEGQELWLLAGWLAFLIFLALALTSNDAAVRFLRRGWKRLHRLVYLAAILLFVHWVLSAFEPQTAYIHLAVLAGLEAVRVALEIRQRVT